MYVCMFLFKIIIYFVNMVLYYYLQKPALLKVCFRNFNRGDEVTLFTTVHFCPGKLILCVNVPQKLHSMG